MVDAQILENPNNHAANLIPGAIDGGEGTYQQLERALVVALVKRGEHTGKARSSIRCTTCSSG